MHSNHDKLLLWCSMVLSVGKAVNPEGLQLSRWWMCLLALDTSQAAATRRRAYTSGNALRFIEELPSTISDISVSSAWFSPSVRFELKPTYVQNPCDHQDADLLAACLSPNHTHVCAPIEPWYGSALLSVPGHTAFLAFGGRAAVDMIQDVPECSHRLGNLAWRFHYHPQLTDPVQLNVSGSAMGVVQRL